MSHLPDVIIIRGAPGSGKTELAKALAKHFPRGAKVEVDALRKMVISVNWTDQAEHIKLLGLAAGTTAEFVRIGFRPAIVIDTFSGDKVDGFLSRLKELNVDLTTRIFGLYVSPEVLSRRLAARREDEFKDARISLKLNADVMKINRAEEVQMDSTELTAAELALGVISSLALVRPMRVGAIIAG